MAEIKIDRFLSYIEGTQRVYDEATTLENTKDTIKKIGVTRIADITNLDRLGIPVFFGTMPKCRSGSDQYILRQGFDRAASSDFGYNGEF